MGYLILWYGYPIFRGDNLENNEKLPIYSYSKVKSFYNCPFYFFKNYLDRPEDFTGHSLSVSDIVVLNENGKVKEGYKDSIELSNQYNLYRQDYCGCKFSKTLIASSL